MGFMDQWTLDMNELDVDFALYSSYEDALAGTNGWKYCNYDHTNVGFPRDCGPHGWVGDQWNAYPRTHSSAKHNGFYVEKPENEKKVEKEENEKEEEKEENEKNEENEKKEEEEENEKEEEKEENEKN